MFDLWTFRFCIFYVLIVDVWVFVTILSLFYFYEWWISVAILASSQQHGCAKARQAIGPGATARPSQAPCRGIYERVCEEVLRAVSCEVGGQRR